MKTIFAPPQHNQPEYETTRNTLRQMPLYRRIEETIHAAFTFALWSLRRRGGQYLPVACAFLLLVITTQTIGMLHDVASAQTRQTIAQSWRGPYDLLVRPSSTLSQVEQTTGWIDPQSALESYGGISLQQVATIRALPHIVAIAPFANVGWQSMAVQVPLLLPSEGIYRVSATWSGQMIDASNSATYVEVTDLAHLTSEQPVTSPTLNYLIAPDSTKPVMYTLSIPALQTMIGVPIAQQSTLSRVLLTGSSTAPPMRLTVYVEKLLGDRNTLPQCIQRANCWQSQSVRQGTVTYQSSGVQLLRFSHAVYTATSQQIASGQVTVDAISADLQGPLYRLPLSEHVAIPDNFTFPGGTLSPETALLPLTGPERLPFLPNAVRFIPLDQACAINGVNCYSGMYVRLSGVEQYNQSSIALLQATAATISAHTGLHVDILDGSSVRQIGLTTVGAYNNAMIQTSWRVVGVAVQIVHGLDTLQEMLLLLCSIVCLLAVGIAGVLVGSGRAKDIELLQQLGWHRSLLTIVLLLDALFLCLPGFLLSACFIIFAAHIWQSSLVSSILWILLVTGIALYGCVLVVVASTSSSKRTRRFNGQLWQGKVIVPFANVLALLIAVFLIAIEYLLVTDFNQVLVVTVLGKQVQAVLEASQVFLFLLILAAALLTVALCTTLLVRGRREEIVLLSQIGWEQRAVSWRLLWSSWRPALISGEVGVFLALGIVSIGGAMPPVEISLSALLVGPLIGMLLTTIASLGPVWYETKRVFAWR